MLFRSVLSNFSTGNGKSFDFDVSPMLADWRLPDGASRFRDVLTGNRYTVTFSAGKATVPVRLDPLQSLILERLP